MILEDKIVEYRLRVTTDELSQCACDMMMHKVFDSLLDLLPEESKLKLSKIEKDGGLNEQT